MCSKCAGMGHKLVGWLNFRELFVNYKCFTRFEGTKWFPAMTYEQHRRAMGKARKTTHGAHCTLEPNSNLRLKTMWPHLLSNEAELNNLQLLVLLETACKNMIFCVMVCNAYECIEMRQHSIDTQMEQGLAWPRLRTKIINHILHCKTIINKTNNIHCISS